MTSYVALWTVIVGLLAWSWFRPTPKPLIDPATRVALQALQATRAIDSARIDSLKRSSAASEARATLAIARAGAWERRADANRALADSLARSAATVDSGAIGQPDRWREAYDARTAEAGDLRLAVSQKDSALDARAVSLRDVHVALDSSEARRGRVEVVNTKLSKAVENAERGCRIAWLVPCPSRKQAAVGGAVLGVLGTLAVQIKKL